MTTNTAVQVQYRRGTAAQVAAFVGAPGEVVIDTTNNRTVVQDGVTPGGWPAAKFAEIASVVRTTITQSYQALATDRLIAVAQLAAPVTVALPPAASYQPGARLLIIDETGQPSSQGFQIKIVPSGTDILAGAYSPSIAIPYGFLEMESNGVGQWTMSDGVLSSFSSSSSSGVGSSSSGAFSGQALIGVSAPLFSVVIAESRLKAGMRPIVGVVNSLIASRGILANVNMTGFAPGEISIFGVLYALDGKPAQQQAARLLLTLNYIGA